MTRPRASHPRPPIYRVVEDVTPDVVAAFVREAISAGYRTVYLHPRTYEAFRGIVLPADDIGPMQRVGRFPWPGKTVQVLPESTLPENALWALDEDPPAVPWEAP